MKRTLIALALSAVSAGAVLTAQGPARADGCAVSWGSAPKAVRSTAHSTLTAVRVGRHACFDRLVLDVASSRTGWSVRYVSAVRDQGRGEVVPLRGGAFLEVVDQAHVTRRLTMPPVAGFTTFRQVGYGGSFEGSTTVGLGVRARLPFRVSAVDGHLVVDVAHHW